MTAAGKRRDLGEGEGKFKGHFGSFKPALLPIF